jgi:hypothetical protein
MGSIPTERQTRPAYRTRARTTTRGLERSSRDGHRKGRRGANVVHALCFMRWSATQTGLSPDIHTSVNDILGIRFVFTWGGITQRATFQRDHSHADPARGGRVKSSRGELSQELPLYTTRSYSLGMNYEPSGSFSTRFDAKTRKTLIEVTVSLGEKRFEVSGGVR